MGAVVGRRALQVALLVVLAVLTACGAATPARSAEPDIVVTTGILGDVVSNLVGDDASVEVLMPPSANPHDFAPSARQIESLRQAAVVVINGQGFEASLDDVIGSARHDGATVLDASSYVELIPWDSLGSAAPGQPPGRSGQGKLDPHFFTDPSRMVQVAAGLANDLAQSIPALDSPEGRAHARGYEGRLGDLDREVEELVSTLPLQRRKLVTNHEVFGYFAQRYGFEVLGAVLPGGSTLAQPSAADLAALARLIDDAGVSVIFVDASASSRLARTLATEGHHVKLVELFSESLGPAGSAGDTYIGMIRSNAERIVEALRASP